MSQSTDYANSLVETINAVITSGQTTSAIIDVSATTIKTIILPVAFDGANLTFTVSDDGITFYDYYNVDNIAVSITCTQGRAYGLAAIDFYSIRFLKIVSSATESADRTIKLILRSI